MNWKGNHRTHAVYLGDKQLNHAPSLKVRNHSPTGFSWGYGGSGPAQLALAMLLAHGLRKTDALRHYQQFKYDIIANLPYDQDFELSDAKITAWLEAQKVGK